MTLQELRELAEKAPKGPYEADDRGMCVWQPNAKIGGVTKLVDVRGWGYLTGNGHGALGLSEDEAIAIQKTTSEYIAACSPQTILALLDVVEKAGDIKTAAMATKAEWDEIRQGSKLPGEPLVHVRLDFVEKLYNALSKLTEVLNA